MFGGRGSVPREVIEGVELLRLRTAGIGRLVGLRRTAGLVRLA